MLTRLRVEGFKSLEDVEVRFGPFTCIAGVNGVGKSNLFDAIQFLKYLADYPIVDAAMKIRNDSGRKVSIASLLTKTATHHAATMAFEADLLVSKNVVDDAGREGKPTATFLTYKLALRYVAAAAAAPERLELVSESLTAVPKSEGEAALGFPLSKAFLRAAYHGTSKRDFISMDGESDGAVKICQDQTAAPPMTVSIAKAERTVLSGVSSNDHPTILAARREMQSWGLLQLEPRALREPDDFSAPAVFSVSGQHLPATLARLNKDEAVAGWLAHLLPDLAHVSVDVDNQREVKTLYVETHNGIKHEARALSDGTLRFLALAIVGADPERGSLMCIEEPENSIPPGHIETLVELLDSMVVDATDRVDEINPLRQIVVNSHSPLLVQRLRPEDIVVAQTYKRGGAMFSTFSPLVGTWRSRCAASSAGLVTAVGFGPLLAYLNQSDASQGTIDGKESVLQAFRRQFDLALD